MKRGFTMLELLLAILLLSIMTIVSTIVFRTVVRNWTLATEMADGMQRVDYVTAQVTAALRSAFFPTTGDVSEADGFMLVNGNQRNEPDLSDSIEWTKLGPAIVGGDSRFANAEHRVTLYVQDERGADETHPAGLTARVTAVKKFRSDDFDPDEDEYWDWFTLSPQVQGFNCRVLDKDSPFDGERANWVDEWSTSNCLPRRVELTFWMKPVEEGGDPYPVVRVVDLPLWDISQNPLRTDSTGGSGGAGGAGGERGNRGGIVRPGGGGPPAGGGAR